MTRSGAKAAAVAFRPLSVVDSPTLADYHDRSNSKSGSAGLPPAHSKSRFGASARKLIIAGALALSALGVAASTAQAGAVRTDAAFAANELPANDDQSTGLVDIGFAANFFGTTYDQLYVNNNGNVTFDQALGEYTPFDLTSTDTVIVAPFFADVDTSVDDSQPARYGQTFGAGVVNGRPAFGVNYINVGYYGSESTNSNGEPTPTKLNSFQVVLVDRSDTGTGNFDIELNYDKIQWETGDASDGIDGLGGSSARAGFSNGTGDAGTFFELPGSAVNGAFLDSNTDTGLIYNSLNSNVPGRYVFQVRSGQVTRTLSINDVSVTEGNSGTVNANFTVTLSPASDDNVTVAYATANGTATQPGDYTPTLGTLTFAPGDTTKTVSVAVKGDTTIEPDETFFVNLSAPTGGATLGDAQGQGTIINDDVAPSVSNIARSTNEDTTLTFTAANFDGAFDGAFADTLQSVRVDTLPANGTLKLSGVNVTANQVIPRANLGNLTFVPALNFNGATSFKYNASNGANFAATGANVNITVIAVNDAPTISDIANKTINEDTTTGAIPFTIGDVDNTPASLTVSATSSNTTLVPVANIVFGGSGANRTVTVTPVADGFGTATITIKVSDGSLNASDTFVLSVNSVNDVPSFTVGGNQSAGFNAGAQNVPGFATNLRSGPANESGQTLTFVVTNNNNALFSAQPAIDADGTLTYSAAANASGTATVTVKIKDNGGTANGGVDTSAAQTFTITIAAGNQDNTAPTLGDGILSAARGAAFTYPLVARDAEGDTLSYSVTGGALPPGVALGSDGILSGTPTQTGVFGFTVTVNDGNGGVGTARFNLTVNTKTDGVAPIFTRNVVPRSLTRDQLASLSVSGTVRDVASVGAVPTGVKRVQVQLRRNSDGFAYNGKAFTSSLSPYYVANQGAASPNTTSGTRLYSRSLSFVPSDLAPGAYSLIVVSLDNAGNYSGETIPVTVVSDSVSSLRAPVRAPSGGAS